MSDYLSWFAWTDASPTARALTAGLAVALTLVSVLVHRQTTFPGPLSRAERAAARATLLRRRGAMAVYFATAVAWTAALILLALPPRRPVVLMLESRAQFESLADAEVQCPARGQEAPVVPFRELAPGAAVKDLGVLVDAVLKQCGARCERFEDTPEEREDLARRVKEALRDTDVETLIGGGRVSRGLEANDQRRFPYVPRPVLESIEVSVLQLALTHFNVREVRVVPGTSFESQASWDVARSLLGGPGLRLCGPGASKLPREPVVVRLADVTRLANGQLVGWALVNGRFPAGATSHEVKLSIEAWGATRAGPELLPNATLPLLLTADAMSSRIVRLCFGTGCSGDLSPDEVANRLAPVLDAARTRGARIRLRADHTKSGLDVWAPVRVVTVAESPPDLQVVGGPPQGWLRLFDEVASAPRYAAFRDELAAMGLQVPRLVTVSQDAQTPSLVPGRDWIAIGVDEAAAKSAATHGGAEASPASTREGRVNAGGMLSPPTVFSLVHLPFRPTLGAGTPGLGVLATAEQQGEAGGGGSAPLVREGFDGPGRTFFVLGVGELAERLELTSSRYEPVTALALVRAVSWAAQRVRDGAIGTPPRLSAQRAHVSQLARPLMTPADLREAARLGTRGSDTLWLGVMSLTLLVTAITLLRRTPEANATPRSGESPRGGA